MGKTFKNQISGGMSGGLDALIPQSLPKETPSKQTPAVKNVNFAIDTDLYRRLKVTAANQGILIKEALADAIEAYLNKFQEVK